MGGDGGVKATQRRFIRGTRDGETKKTDSESIRSRQRLRSKLCKLTDMPLAHPIVACEMGNLYNKEDILTALLEKTLPPQLSHIRGLKVLVLLRCRLLFFYDFVFSLRISNNWS